MYKEQYCEIKVIKKKHLCYFGIEGIMRNNSVNLFGIWASGSGGVV